MQPILDETSLVPYPELPCAVRIENLACALSQMDKIGFSRGLRTVRDAADRDLEAGAGLRRWCFDSRIKRESGLLLAGRLSKQPFIDGPDGLFAAAEGDKVVEATSDGLPSLGLGLAVLEEGVVVALGTARRPSGSIADVHIHEFDGDAERCREAELFVHVSQEDVAKRGELLRQRLERNVSDGAVLIHRFSHLYPQLVLGPRATQQMGELTGHEPQFRQLLVHLRSLDLTAQRWQSGAPFEPGAVAFSVESQMTLQHGRFGPMRDFPMPEGYRPRRWSLHTKLTGGSGARLYFIPEWAESLKDRKVLIGYFGPHLPCVRYPT